MLLALLERKLDLPFNQYDVYINIAGGIKINETSAILQLLQPLLVHTVTALLVKTPFSLVKFH